MADLSYIADNINTLLRLRGMTQTELAKKTNSAVSTVHTWCSGAKLPSLSALVSMAEALGVGPDDLIIPLTYELTGERELTKPCENLYTDLFGVGYKDMPLNCEELLNEVIDETLNESEQKILVGRYGLNGQPKQTLRDLSEEMGLSCERIRQIEDKAKAKLRKKKYFLLPEAKETVESIVPEQTGYSWADVVPLSELNLSTRASNCMFKNRIRNLGDILRLKDIEMANMKGLGPQSMAELNRLRRLIWSHEDMGPDVLNLI